jgi:hypothetical protein
MPALPGKKHIVIGAKISQAEQDAFETIARNQDRSMSYVLRELAVRGMAQYFRDGHIKATADDETVIARGRSGGGVARTSAIDAVPSDDDLTFERFEKEIDILQIGHIAFEENIRHAPPEKLRLILEDVKKSIRKTLEKEIKNYGTPPAATGAARQHRNK